MVEWSVGLMAGKLVAEMAVMKVESMAELMVVLLAVHLVVKSD